MQQYNTASNQGNNTVMALSFNGNNLTPVQRDGQIWMTASDLAKSLGYSRSDKVTQIFNRNADEFGENMSQIINNPQNPNLRLRVFSLRGCHMIAMFARTDIAKDFRVWVLDILDREVGAPVADQSPAITDADWTRYARSMTIPEMVQLTGYDKREVVNALHKVMGGRTSTANPAPVMTPELQTALDQFWRFVAAQDLATINHSSQSHELAISLPEIYQLDTKGVLPDTRLIYKALRLSDTPRFNRANTVMASAVAKKSQRVWVFIKSLNQPAIK